MRIPVWGAGWALAGGAEIEAEALYKGFLWSCPFL